MLNMNSNDDISTDADETPDWIAEILDERQQKVKSGQAKFYTFEEVEERRANRLQPFSEAHMELLKQRLADARN
ncbi:MAG: hypothetical protein JWO94_3699, partial [Verrucomicrobiaceae bacterium]|nr:hypothetical protein [Verrucomicrobiaceae bacterium]